MDSLMEALQTGSAFSRPDQRRKRQTRAAGGKSRLGPKTKNYVTLASRLKFANKAWKFKRSLKQANIGGPSIESHDTTNSNNESFSDFGKEFDSIISGIKGLIDNDNDVSKLEISIVSDKIKLYSNMDENKKVIQNPKKKAHKRVQKHSSNSKKAISASRQKIVVSKRPKRNAFVRQAVIRRRRKIEKRTKSGRLGKYLGSPPNANVTLPSFPKSVISPNPRKIIKPHVSMSCNDLPTIINEASVALLLSKFANEQQNPKEADENDNTLNVSLERTYDKCEEPPIDDTMTAANSNFLEKKTQKLKRLFTFRGQKLSESFRSFSSNDGKRISPQVNVVNAISPQTEIYKRSVNWKIWKGTKNTGKFTIPVDQRSNK